jgi:hypothetical protein
MWISLLTLRWTNYGARGGEQSGGLQQVTASPVHQLSPS